MTTQRRLVNIQRWRSGTSSASHLHLRDNRIAFSPYIVAVVGLIQELLSEIDNNEEGIKVFDKSICIVEENS